MVTEDGSALKYASMELQADKEVVTTAVSYRASPAEGDAGREEFVPPRAGKGPCGAALEFASAELQADKDVVLAAVALDGNALQWAASTLKGDLTVAMAAVTQNQDAVQHVAEALRPEVCHSFVTCARCTAVHCRNMSLQGRKVRAVRFYYAL